jgi:hypothetical protein
MKIFDSYYDSPDEDEEVFCEYCGTELESRYQVAEEDSLVCINPLCPEIFDGVSKEMAQLIVEQKEKIESLNDKIKYYTRKISWLEFQRDEKEKGE